MGVSENGVYDLPQFLAILTGKYWKKSHLIWDMALCTQKISRCHRRSQEHLTRLIELERSQIHSADSFTQAAWWVWWVGGCTTFWAHKMLGI